MIIAVVVTLLLAQAEAAVQPTWFEHYETALRHIEDGDAAAARAALNRAVSLRPDEGLQLPTRPMQYIDYLPHLYLGIASQMLGDVDAARRHMAEAKRSGLAMQSEAARPLFLAYEQLLRGELSGKYERPRFAVFPQREPVLSEAQFEQLKSAVLAHCNVPPNSKLADAPWYAHYELGLEVQRRGDPWRALNLFLEAINRRPDPQRRARMYGMWLIDYYPYFNIARSHLQLGNFECAADALEISAKLNEIKPESPQFNEYLALKTEMERQKE